MKHLLVEWDEGGQMKYALGGQVPAVEVLGVLEIVKAQILAGVVQAAAPAQPAVVVPNGRPLPNLRG